MKYADVSKAELSTGFVKYADVRYNRQALKTRMVYGNKHTAARFDIFSEFIKY